jgi:hypothetical protein
MKLSVAPAQLVYDISAAPFFLVDVDVFQDSSSL